MYNLETFMTDAKLPKRIKQKCRVATELAAKKLDLEKSAKRFLASFPHVLKTEVLIFIHRKVILE